MLHASFWSGCETTWTTERAVDEVLSMNEVVTECVVQGLRNENISAFQGMSQLNDRDISECVEGVVGFSSPLA